MAMEVVTMVVVVEVAVEGAAVVEVVDGDADIVVNDACCLWHERRRAMWGVEAQVHACISGRVNERKQVSCCTICGCLFCFTTAVARYFWPSVGMTVL